MQFLIALVVMLAVAVLFVLPTVAASDLVADLATLLDSSLR